MWGGRGDTMINMDDDHDTTLHTTDPLANNQPDNFAAYGDIAYGGAGLDRLILNTGRDRAIDWVGHVYYSLVTSGDVGLLVAEGTSWFGQAEARTNDPSYVDPGDALLAAQQPAGAISTPVMLTDEQLPPLVEEAYRRLVEVVGAELATVGLDELTFEIVDLPDMQLAAERDRRIMIDATGAGHGWFVDATPGDDAEFRLEMEPGVLLAVPSSPASGAIDLLTVLMHEIAHSFGFDHDTAGQLMASTLDVSTRILPSTLSVGTQWEATSSLTAGSLDVNGDGWVTPLDALLIINFLHRNDGAADSTTMAGGINLDVNRDGLVSPMDALLVINHLNRQNVTIGGHIKVADLLFLNLEFEGEDEEDEELFAQLASEGLVNHRHPQIADDGVRAADLLFTNQDFSEDDDEDEELFSLLATSAISN